MWYITILKMVYEIYCHALLSFPMSHSPVRRKSTILNMERMVGTMTPKKVLSLRGFDLGDPSSVTADPPLESSASPIMLYTPWTRRGECSFAMVWKTGTCRRNRFLFSTNKKRQVDFFLNFLSAIDCFYYYWNMHNVNYCSKVWAL